MKKLLLAFSVLGACAALNAQVSPKINQLATSQEVDMCSQHHKMAQLMLEHPEAYAEMMTGPLEGQAEHHSSSVLKTTGLIYTIPVVFHILHNGGTENVSEAQIMDALNILNRDYRRLNADADQVVTAFQGMPKDVEIEFVLATVAPNGNCFGGITRTQSTATNNGSNGQTQVNAIVAGNDIYQGVWAHNRYLNIYVCKNIGGAAGYTFNPNNAGATAQEKMYYNGIFILQDYFGSIGTSSEYNSRALTHEVGHWLNLAHVWGSTNDPGVDCSGTDNVNDTPATEGSVLECNLSANTCTNDNAYWGFNQIDNVENYMDYSYCSKMFTQGQVDRMRASLTSSVGGRNNIWTTANLNLVGGGPGTSLCAIDFTASQTTMCAGTTVTYTPNTTTGISAYSWSFPGGTPSTSTLQNPTVTYATAGTYNASLTVTATSNGQTYPKTKTNYILANTNTTVSLPLSQGFTTATFPPTGWTIVNGNGTGTTWARSSTIGVTPTAGNSMFFDNYNYNDPTDDEVRLPKLDILSYSSAQLTFDVAYAPYDATNYDGLQVLVSTDCGGTFTSVFLKSNTVLATASAVQAAFTPSNSQWRTETIDLTPYVGNSSVWIAFRNLSGYGNRLFVDNINVTGVSGSPSAPTASFTSSGTSVCAGQSISFTSTSTGNPTSYSWSFPGGTPSTSTLQNPTVTYATAGTYDVTLTATNVGGSNASNQTSYVTVNAAPAAPSITASGNVTFCQGSSVTLTSSASSGNSWSSGSTANSITTANSGTFTVTQTVAGCTSPASNAVVVTVNSNPSVSFSGVGQLCVYDDPITLTQGSPGGGTYSGTGVTGTTFNPAVAGTGTTVVTYNFTNSNGCSGSAQTGISVSQCLGVEEEAMELIGVYPNPSSGVIMIDAGDQTLQLIEVYDRMGKLVFQRYVNSETEQEIDLTQVASGLYTVQVVTQKGTQHVAVVIEN